jgi:hypothetical protein
LACEQGCKLEHFPPRLDKQKQGLVMNIGTEWR